MSEDRFERSDKTYWKHLEEQDRRQQQCEDKASSIVMICGSIIIITVLACFLFQY